MSRLGDVIDLLLAERLIRRCKKIEGGLPPKLQTKMRVYAIAAFAVGLAPYVGDFIDNFLRYNMRNVAMLEEYLKEKYGPEEPDLRKLSGLEACGDDEVAREFLAKYPGRNSPRGAVAYVEKSAHHGQHRFDDRLEAPSREEVAVVSGNEKLDASQAQRSSRKARRA